MNGGVDVHCGLTGNSVTIFLRRGRGMNCIAGGIGRQTGLADGNPGLRSASRGERGRVLGNVHYIH